MARPPKIFLAIVAFLALLPLPAPAEIATLVADLAQGSAAHGSYLYGPMVVVDQPAQHRQSMFFTADDGRHGRELWVSEITGGVEDAGPPATRMVTDLCPGPCAGDPQGLTAVGDRLFFFAFDGLYRRALYTTRGQDADVTRVRELIEPDQASYSGGEAFGDLFVFAATFDGCHFVWASDGTAAKTRPVLCLGGLVNRLVASPSGIYVETTDVGLHKLEPDDSTATGFRLVAIGPRVHDAAVLGDRLIFSTAEPRAVYATDGGPPQLLRRVEPGYLLTLLERFGDQVIFEEYAFIHPEFHHHRFRTDGTAAGTGPSPELAFAEEMDLRPWSPGDPVLLVWDHETSQAYGVTAEEHRLLPSLVHRPTPIRKTTLAGGTLFVMGLGLYHVDADFVVRQATAQLPDASYAPPYAASPSLAAGDFYFRLGPDAADEPYVAPGGGGPAQRVADIARDDIRSFNPHPIGTVGGFLAAVESLHPFARPDLVEGPLAAIDSDATSATVIDPGPYQVLAGTAGRLFLLGGASGRRLFASTGGPAVDLGVDRVAPPWTGTRPGTFNGQLYFTTHEPGQDVFFSDGTVAGTRFLYDAAPGWQICTLPVGCGNIDDELTFPYVILADQHRVFWNSHPADEPHELYTARPGDHDFDILTLITNWGGFPVLLDQGRLYFIAGLMAPEIWVTDGTQASTRKLVTLPASVYRPYHFVSHRGHVYFAPPRPDGSQVLWRTDGTPEGTAPFHDFGPGTVIGEMKAWPVGGLFVAVAIPGLGAELWSIDQGAPFLVRDIRPGARGSFPHEFHRAEDERLVFVADDGIHGAEAWISDGTTEGTRLLADLGPGASAPRHFAERFRRLVFSADDGVHGRELWTLVPGEACPPYRLCLQNDRFEVQVDYLTPTGEPGGGQRVLASAESGVFSFFSPENWELQVKVLDGCALNQRFWVFASATTNVQYVLTVTDRATGAMRSYSNPQGILSAAVTDTDAFATCGAPAPAPRYVPDGPRGAMAPICPDDENAFCIGDYRLSVTWETAAGSRGVATPVARGAAESGLFTFFSPDNWEMMVKLLDGCSLNGHRWLFAAGSTDVGWTLTLEHLFDASISPKVYTNPPGAVSPALADVTAAVCR